MNNPAGPDTSLVPVRGTRPDISLPGHRPADIVRRAGQAAVAEQVVRMTTQDKPLKATQWSTRTMAEASS